jgi:CheY-like chemotaxis protein
MIPHLLLVEDDPIFTYLLEKAIQSVELPGEISAFSNGLKAIDYLKKEYHKDKQYVIFLDLNMPVMNGWQFMEKIETIAAVSNVIVFIVTSSNYQKDIDLLMENLFVADFITKPINESIMKGVKERIASKFEG